MRNKCFLLLLAGVAESFVIQAPPAPETCQKARRRREDSFGSSGPLATEIARLEETFHRGERSEGSPVNVADWTYLPGIREVMRIRDPVLTYLFSDVVLRGTEMSYVHLLGTDKTVGVEMKVLDTMKDPKEMFSLIHCSRRVLLKELPSIDMHTRITKMEPLLDAEELEDFDTFEAALEDADQWAAFDDAVDDWEPSWLLNGGGHRRHDFMAIPPPAMKKTKTDEQLEKIERTLWIEVEALAALIRKSRTSGRYDLPKPLLALRGATKNPNYPPRRRALRLSFAIAQILDWNRNEDRQALLECTSTSERLELAINKVASERSDLADALVSEGKVSQNTALFLE